MITIIQNTDGCSHDDLDCLILPDGMNVEKERKKMYSHYLPNECTMKLAEWLIFWGAKRVSKDKIRIIVE